MRRYYIFLIAIAFSEFSFGNSLHILGSPDRSISVKVNVAAKITYTLSYQGQLVFKESPISLITENYVFGTAAEVKKSTLTTHQEIVKTPIGIFSEVENYYNELLLDFENYSIIFRAYNNGFAWRFATRINGSIKILNEEASFNFASSPYLFFPVLKPNEYESSYEKNYPKKNIDSIINGNFTFAPILVDIPNTAKLVITEADLLDYPGMLLKKQDHSLMGEFVKVPSKTEIGGGSNFNMKVKSRTDYIAETEGTRSFPWRLVIIEKEEKKLLENELVYLLSTPSKIADVSWIKPGKVAWDWWCDWNLDNVDFKTGVNNQTYKYFIDFASKNGIEYIVMDEGWSDSHDLLKMKPDVNVPELVQYAKSKNVGIILWCVWHVFDRQMKEALDQFEKWGIAGLKIDFIDRDDQIAVNFYERASAAIAERKMLVDFHGAFKETGLRRTYPNLINREGIMGAEFNKFCDNCITPEHNVTIPFTRMVTGPMDYTPGAMRNVNINWFKKNYVKPVAIGSRCHQLAMYVVYFAPLQMLADAPTAYENELPILNFLKSVPTVWDKTIGLDGKVAQYVVVARKNGNDWYVGAMNDTTQRTYDVKFDFLDEGKMYLADVYSDGINTSRNPTDYVKASSFVTKNDVISLRMAAGGGFAMRVRLEK